MKKVVVPIVLVAGIGVSIYLWSTMESADAGDNKVMAIKQDYTCTQCKQPFSLTVDEAREMRRSRGDIFCPHCGAASAAKKDVKINMGGPTLGNDEENSESTEEAKEDPKPKAGGSAHKIE